MEFDSYLFAGVAIMFEYNCISKGLISPDAVNDWIVDSISLGEEWAPDGGQGTDVLAFENAGVVDDEVGSPGEEPESNGHQGNLR